MKAVPSPQPPGNPALFSSCGLGKVAVVGQLVEHRHQPPRRAAGTDRVGGEAAHRGEHHVDPSRSADRWAAGPGHHAAELEGGRPPPRVVLCVCQPRHKQPEMFDPDMPVATGACAPVEEERDRAGVGLGRELGTVASEAEVAQVGVGVRNEREIVVHHRPVAHPRWQRHLEHPHSAPRAEGRKE